MPMKHPSLPEEDLPLCSGCDPESFDPCLAHGIPSATICYHIYGSLYLDDVGDIRPALAESYELAEDQVTYTFKLRDGLLWERWRAFDRSGL